VISPFLLPLVLEANERFSCLEIVEASTKDQHRFGDLQFMNYTPRCHCLHIDSDLCLRSARRTP
jgi:hypothetical protein